MSAHEEETPQISTLRYTSIKEDTPYLPLNLAGLTRRAKRGSKRWLMLARTFWDRLFPIASPPPPPPGYLAENLSEFKYEIPMEQEWISRPSLAQRRAEKVRASYRRWAGVGAGVVAVLLAIPLVAVFRFVKPPAPPALELPKPQALAIATPIPTPTRAPQQLSARAALSSTYEVQKGDYWGAIASRYGISVRTLCAANGKTSGTMLRVGEMLQIPVGNGFVHLVQPGDTLSQLLERYDTSLADFQRANGLVDINRLKIGQKLLFTGNGPRP